MTTSEPGRVCVVGSLNVDTTLRVASLPGAGQTVLAHGRTTSQGGKGANQAVAAASQGSSVVLIAAVGDDEQGRSSLDHLADRGVDIGSVRLLDETHTGTAMVLVAEDGEMGPTLLRAEPSADARRRRFATTPLTHVDVLVPNRPELAELVGQAQAETLEDVDRCAKRLDFAGTLVVTLGRQGAVVYGAHGRERLAHVPAAHVEAVYTTSAVTRSAA